MDEKQYAWGVFQDKPDTECMTLDTATSPMVILCTAINFTFNLSWVRLKY
jgi:hypothetical protein